MHTVSNVYSQNDAFVRQSCQEYAAAFGDVGHKVVCEEKYRRASDHAAWMLPEVD